MHRIVLLMALLCWAMPEAKAERPPYPDSEKSYTREEILRRLRAFEEQNDTLGMAFCYLTYARNQEKWNDPNESSVFNYSKSMEMFRLKGDSASYYNAMGALGIYFMERPMFRAYAKDYVLRPVRYFQRSQQPENELGHLINLANVQIQESKLDTAQQLLSRAERLNKIVKNRLFEGRIYAALADLYGHWQQQEQCIAFAEKSLDIARQLQVRWLQAVSLYYIGRSLINRNQPANAVSYLMECEQLTANDLMLIQLRREVYRNMSLMYQMQKEYEKANLYFMRLQETTDYIYNSKVGRDINSFNDYMLITRQKEQLAKVALERKLTKLELDRLQSRQWFYTMVIILAVCLAGASIYITINQQRLNQLREEKIRKNTQIETLSALIHGQESERSRISQELHDGLGTLLSRIKMCVEQPGLEPGHVVQMIDEACGEVRAISGNLQPNTLFQFGLIRAIEDLIIKQKCDTPHIIFQHFGAPVVLPSDRTLMIYRIVQELLTNALKHASASEILVEIVYQTEQMLCLTIEDDGIGFDENNISAESNGWKNIRSRIEYLQGSLWLHSTASVGTTVTIHIPIDAVLEEQSEMAYSRL
jgi:signal transduction histidine kinase